jgi:hypothetical protein
MAPRRVAALAAVVSVVFGVAAAGAAAAGPPNNSYLCYSKFQVDPGVWSDSPSGFKGGLGGNVSSSALLKLGYWSPFAEKSTPTNTKLLGGWYLHCNPPGATLAGAPTAIVGGAGETVGNMSLAVLPGYYPVGP